jgi:hypothetical protein
MIDINFAAILRHRAALGLFVLALMLLSACNQEGLAAFSPANNRIAVITNEFHLYVTDMEGQNAIKIDAQDILWNFSVTFNPIGTKILFVDTDRNVCTANVDGGGKACNIVVPDDANVGFLSFLPSGQYVIAFQQGSVWELRVYDPNDNSLDFSRAGIDNVFPTQDGIKVKRGSSGTEWIMTPYEKPSGQQTLRWVYTVGTTVYSLTAGGTLGAEEQIGQINAAVQNALSDRDQTDITSGLVSPNGQYLAFRTRTGTDPNFSYAIYVVDLTQNGFQPVQLVSNASTRLQFSFSPNNSQLAYESTASGGSVWIANSDGTNPQKLADGASLPTWHSGE